MEKLINILLVKYYIGIGALILSLAIILIVTVRAMLEELFKKRK